MKKEMIQKIKDGLKTSFVDSTAVNAVCNPIFAGLETVVIGMSDDLSLSARLLGTGLTYAGLGTLISKGRDAYRKLVKVNENTREGIQQLHDSIYMGLFCLGFDPLFYYAAGARDIEDIVGGTITGTLFGLTSGGLIGYAMDTFKDLTGIKESSRIPLSIKNLSPKMKLGLVTAITTATIAINAGIYELTPDKKEENSSEKQNTEKVVNYSSTQ